MWVAHNFFTIKVVIIISANSKRKRDEKDYEYKQGDKLKGLSSKHIRIPLSVIIDTDIDSKRVGIFSYLKTHAGLNGVVGFTVSDMVEWCGRKPERKINGTNDKFLEVIDLLSDRGYLTYLTKKSRSSYMKCMLDIDDDSDDDENSEEYSDSDREINREKKFAIVYIDEIEKIMSYKKKNSKDSTLNNTTILLVFAFLRHIIPRRPNFLKPEERYPENIKSRRERIPEAYSGNLNNMAAEIGISDKTFSKIIDILEYDLKLIVTDRAYRVKNEDGEYRTLPTIFANVYKREYNYVLETGDNYAREEIEIRANNIENYKINKNKRKQNK